MYLVSDLATKIIIIISVANSDVHQINLDYVFILALNPWVFKYRRLQLTEQQPL